MRGKALHWIVELPNSHGKLFHADLLEAHMVITFNAGEFWLHVLFEGKDPTKTGPFSDPWLAMEKAEKIIVKAMAMASETP